MQDVGLPWVHTVQVATGGRLKPYSPTIWVKVSSPGKKVSCLIAVDGVPAASGVEQQPKGQSR